MTGNRWLALFVLTTPLAMPAYGQLLNAMQSSKSALTNGVLTGIGTFGTPRKPFAVVTGAPYSAEAVSQFVETLQGGAQITRTGFSRKIYRDGLGRTRVEQFRNNVPQPTPSQNPLPPGPLLVEIDDPVARVFYVLDTQRKIAHRGALPISADPPPAPTDADDAMLAGVNPQAPGQALLTFADLGSQMVGGVVAQGRRVTATWPAGARGNDRPIVATAEIWRSPNLKVIVLAKASKPLVGDQTNQLANLDTNPPDATLFQPPVDYQVVDEPGTFTIAYP
jgi:hypothetical protein